jgi:predicted dehydrogenase
MHQTRSKPLRVGVVGCGRIAQDHLQALAGCPETVITAAVDVDKRRAQEVAKRHDCQWFDSFDAPALLDAVDAVVVCTPPVLHFECARRFLANRISVLCEKPLTLRAADAAALVETAKGSGALLMMASKFRYVDDVSLARQLIRDGTIGHVRLFENSFCGQVDMRTRWNSDRRVAGGGVWVDNGTHSVDIIRYLIGPIVSTKLRIGLSLQDVQVEDTVTADVLTHSGARGRIELSWSRTSCHTDYFAIYGSEGCIHLGWKEAILHRHGTRPMTIGKGYDKRSALSTQLINFVGTIRGSEAPRIDTDDAMASVAVVENAYAATLAQDAVSNARA